MFVAGKKPIPRLSTPCFPAPIRCKEITDEGSRGEGKIWKKARRPHVCLKRDFAGDIGIHESDDFLRAVIVAEQEHEFRNHGFER